MAIELVAVDPDDGVELLRNGDVDAAMVTEVPGEHTDFPGVTTLDVYDDEFFVVLPSGHRLAERTEVPMVDQAHFTSCDHRPIIKAPVWKTPNGPLYPFLGGAVGTRRCRRRSRT